MNAMISLLMEKLLRCSSGDKSVGDFPEILRLFSHSGEQASARGKNIPDLVITSIRDYVKISEVISPDALGIMTDHHILLFELLVTLPRFSKAHKTVYDYQCANSARPCNALSSGNDDMNGDWNFWKNSFFDAVKEGIPMKKLKGRHNAPWINSKVRHLLKNNLSV